MAAPSEGVRRQQGKGGARRTPPPRAKSATNRLMALSGAVIVAVYTAGYARTAVSAQQTNVAMAALRAAAGAEQSGSSLGGTLGAGTYGSSPPPTASGTETAGGAQASAAPPAPSKASAGSSGSAGGAESAPGASGTTPPASAGAPAATKYKDGTYTATGFGPHGPIQATVVIRQGRITSANVTQCGTTYSCSYIQPLIQLVVQRQSAPADYISGATASSYAYYQAVVNALAKA